MKQNGEAPMFIGQRIKEARKEAGVSQEALADTLGITQGAVSQWEREDANPGVDQIPAIAQTLGVTPDWLFSFEVDDNVSPLQRRRTVSGLALLTQLSQALDKEKLSQRQIDLLADLLQQFVGTEKEFVK